MSEDKITARITALLRKAEGTDNEHEADAFMQAAQRLSTLHQVDLETARLAARSGQVREVPTQRTIEIGERGRVGLRTYVALFLKIGLPVTSPAMEPGSTPTVSLPTSTSLKLCMMGNLGLMLNKIRVLQLREDRLIHNAK